MAFRSFTPGAVISSHEPPTGSPLRRKSRFFSYWPFVSPFNCSSFENGKAILPGYDVRFVSVEEQERTDKTMGPEGTAESAFIISKNGRELLWVFSYGLPDEQLKENPALAPTHVVGIEAVAGVIDASGSTLGAPLNKAFRQGKIVCDAHEAGACWSAQLPGIMYVPDQPGECDFLVVSQFEF